MSSMRWLKPWGAQKPKGVAISDVSLQRRLHREEHLRVKLKFLTILKFHQKRFFQKWTYTLLLEYMCVCKQKDIVGVFLQVVQHASFDCKYGTWGFEGCSKRQLSWGFHLTMNDAYERKQPSSLEIAQLTNAVIYIYINIYIYIYRQDFVQVQAHMRLEAHQVYRIKHEVLTTGLAFDMSSSQSGTHF